MKKTILLFGILFLLSGCGKVFELGEDFKIEIESGKKTDCVDTLKEYYKSGTQKVYLVCMDDVKIKTDDFEVPLKSFLKQKENTIDQIADLLASKMEYENAFNDGGTTIYVDKQNVLTIEGLTMVKCDTIEGNRDLYIGPKDLDYGSGLANGYCGHSTDNALLG